MITRYIALFVLGLLISWPHFLLADDRLPLTIQNKALTDNILKGERALNIAYMPPATEFNYYLSIGKGIKAKAIETGNNSFMFAPQSDNPSVQAKMITEVIRRKVDAIILSTHDAAVISPFVARAIEQGIIVIIVNSDTPSFITPVHGIVGYRQYQGTKKMAQYLLKNIAQEPLNVAVIEGEPGYHSTERVNGFSDALIGSKLKIVAKENGKWNTEGGYIAGLKIFKEHPEIGVVFAANDYEIIGVESALQSLEKKGVILLANDGDHAVLEKIHEGRVTATVFTDPIGMGKVATKMAIDIINGRSKGGFIATDTTIVDKSNLAQFWQEPVKTANINLKEITIVSDERKDLTNLNSSGLYWDLMRAIFEPIGISVKTKIRPPKRAAQEVKYNKSDAMLGAVHGEISGVLYPQWYYSVDYISVMFDKSKFSKWSGQDTFANKHVTWIRGYNYEKYLYVPVDDALQTNNRIQGLKLLATGRVEFLFDNFFDLQQAILASSDELKINHFVESDYQIKHILENKQYIAFSNSEKGMYMMKLFDERFSKMLFSGEIKALFDKWNYPYPFD